MTKKEITRQLSIVRRSERELGKALMCLHENGTPVYWRRRRDKKGTIEIMTIDLSVADQEGCTRAFLS